MVELVGGGSVINGAHPVYTLFSTPGQSQGLRYKHLGDSLINRLSDPLSKYLYDAAMS